MYHMCCIGQDYCVKSTCDGPSSLTNVLTAHHTAPVCVPNVSHKEVLFLYSRVFVYFVLAGLQINPDFENMMLLRNI